ncbi:MAG TPA: hypothetical protein ENJ77_00090 [Candidatus Moranbacteria bacterium]|nr:hypothetical protein [Candidatus Moranbacteria bacterium]
MERIKPSSPIVTPEKLPKTPQEAEKLLLTTEQLKEMMEEGLEKKKIKEAIEKAKEAGFEPEAKVKIEPFGRGVVVGYNENPDGYYPGDLYPVLVRLSSGRVIECTLEQLSLLAPASEK